MKIGFGKVDITPRVGVELCGFGPFINRHSIGIRDRLFARAVAFQDDTTTLILVSCDLVAVVQSTTQATRRLVCAATGVPEACIMVHCTHTHSGPNTDPDLIGWGELDPPYCEVLPHRIAAACVQSVANLRPAVLAHAEVPCEGIALNREYDQDAPPLDQVLRDDWRPAKPELTDTTCHVLKATTTDARAQTFGFLSYYGCHPVTCCSATRYIHGDFVGVATNLLEREYPGATGLFLQGALGDVNSCVVHKPETESLLALDVIAGRYARALRAGLARAQPLAAEPLRHARRETTFSRIRPPLDELRRWLADEEALFRGKEMPGSDTDQPVRMAAVTVHALRRIIPALERGENINPPTELQGFRLGPLALLGAPFEIFQAIKNEARAQARAPIPLIIGLTNDELGYATDRTAAARGGYAAQKVPIMLGRLPFANIHDELVREIVDLDAALQ